MGILPALELSLLLVCIWGLIAVLLTGQFSSVVIIGCIAALIIGYRMRKNGWQPTPLVANIAAILVFATAGIIFFTGLNLLVATVYLFLFLQVTKYVTRQNLTEIRWCYLISLFHVIGASVITTAITFGLMLVVYIFLVLLSLRLYVLARGWESSLTAEERASVNQTRRSLLTLRVPKVTGAPSVPKTWLRTSAALTVIVVLLSAGLFSAIPRLATQNLFQAYGPAPEEPAVSAFSEDVEFGSFTEIQQDDAVALFVEPVGEKRPNHVRMRGVALDSFNGKAWKRTNGIINSSHQYDFQPLFTTRLYPDRYIYRVIQPPGVTNFLFGDSFPIRVTVPAPFLFSVDRMAQAVFLDEMPPKEFRYEVESMHEDLALRLDPALSPDIIARPVDNLIYGTDRTERRGGNDEKRGLGGDLAHLVELLQERLAANSLTSETWALFMGNIDPFSLAERNREQEAKPATTDTESMSYESRRRRWDSMTSEARAQYRRDRGHYQEGGWSGGDSADWDGRQRRGHGDPSFWGEFIPGEYAPRSQRERLQWYLAKCLRVPDMLATGRVPELAMEWTQDEATTFAKAMAIERRLRNEFGYSLTPTATGNFIDNFLFEVQEGHCEYFATSMAILLRNIGIPSRVVNGFYSNEWNPISGNFTVRQRDAHSWVEAWMGDNYGWMTFDPTPPAGVSRRGDAFLQNIFRVLDAVRVRWYRYVVDYSISDQANVIREIMQWRRALMRKLEQTEILGISKEDSTPIELGDFSGEIDWRPVALSGAVIMLLILWQGGRFYLRRRKGHFSRVRFYDEILTLLARRGFAIAPGQTPMEFARYVSAINQQWSNLVEATNIYYANKYKGETLHAGDQQVISDLKNALKQRPPAKG